MNYETAQRVWNCMQQCSNSYTVNELYKNQIELENIVLSRKQENVSAVSAVAMLLIGLGLSSMEMFTQTQQIDLMRVSIGIAIVCGIYFSVSCMTRLYRANKISTMIFSIKKLIAKKRIVNHRNSMVIQSTIQAWCRLLINHRVDEGKITKFKNFLAENLRTEFVNDPHDVLSVECIHLRLAARHAGIEITEFIPRKQITHQKRVASTIVA